MYFHKRESLKIAVLVMIFVALASQPGHGARGDTYGKCDAPLQSYSCFDRAETPICPEVGTKYVPGYCSGPSNIQCCAPEDAPIGTRVAEGSCVSVCSDYKCMDVSRYSCPSGLEPVRGWCAGTSNIQCCAPPGTPEGPKTDPSVQSRIDSGEVTCEEGGFFTNLFGSNGEGPQLPDVHELKTDSFSVFVEGNIRCSIKAQSNGEITRDESVTCDSYVPIKVGPAGDCRHEGNGVCKVIKSGLVSSDEKIYNIRFPDTTDYGRCSEPYGEFSCRDDITYSCEDRHGGTFLSGYCPGQPVNIRCCVPLESVESEEEHVRQLAEDNLISNEEHLESKLRKFSEDVGANIIIEIYENIAGDAVQLGSDKFYFVYGMGKSEHQQDVLILYDISLNRFYVFRNPQCGIDEKHISDTLQEPEIRLALEDANFDVVFSRLSEALMSEIRGKIESGEPCVSSTACQKRCEEGFLSSCGENKCVSNGCFWNSKYDACIDIGVTQSETTIQQRLELVRNGFKSFVDRDPLCFGANCAKYVTRVHEFVFGTGKHFITGVGGNAWNIPANVEARGGSVTWYDWRNGEIFEDYESLIPGDVIGFHFTQSDYLPDRQGRELGNTEDTDFTHVALYLGKNGDKHVITHLFQPPDCSEELERAGVCGPVWIESIDRFLGNYGHLFKIRAVVRPEQEKLYRVTPDDYRPEFRMSVVKSGDTLAQKVTNIISRSLLPARSEQYMWLTADINGLVENVVLNKYAGKTILIPQSLPDRYSSQTIDEIYETPLVAELAAAIKQKYPDKENAREWAAEIVKHAKYKTPEYVSLISSFVDQESQYNENPGGVKEFFSDISYRISNFIAGVSESDKPGGPTLGCMQIRLCSAAGIAEKEGLDTPKVEEELRKIDGCLFYGNKYVEKIAEIYASGEPDEKAMLFIAADYHSGPFSSRNAALQQHLNDIMGTSLAMDGDMLAYENTCPPGPRQSASNTELVIREFVQQHGLEMSPDQIREMLEKEKTKEFENTRIYQEIKHAWVGMFGNEPEYAVITNAKTYVRYAGIANSLNYARRTKDFYNNYCSRIACSNPDQIHLVV